MILRKYLFPFIIWFFYRILLSTWRLTIIEPTPLKDAMKNRTLFLMAHWHGDEAVLVFLMKKYRLATMVSKSNDGEMMTSLVYLLGGKTCRGSTSKGASSGLKALIKLQKEGNNISLSVDGPKGPYHKVKPGIFELSRLFNAPIYSAGVSCDRAWYFEKAWNKAFIPKPFARIVVVWNGPFSPLDKKENPRSEFLATQMETTMEEAKLLANNYLKNN